MIDALGNTALRPPRYGEAGTGLLTGVNSINGDTPVVVSTVGPSACRSLPMKVDALWEAMSARVATRLGLTKGTLCSLRSSRTLAGLNC